MLTCSCAHILVCLPSSGETVPILDYYRPRGVVKEVNAHQQIDKVWGEVSAGLQ